MPKDMNKITLSTNFPLFIQKLSHGPWLQIGMFSGSGSGDPSSNPGRGEEICNLSLLFWVRIGIVVLIQICTILCVYKESVAKTQGGGY